jgi:hypothetical protein
MSNRRLVMERARSGRDPDRGDDVAPVHRGVSEAAAPAPTRSAAGRRGSRGAPAEEARGAGRIESILEAVREKGLLDGETTRIGARVRLPLIEAAKRHSGIRSDTDLIEYALARVALEDDFVAKLYALEGTIDPSVDLEF